MPISERIGALATAIESSSPTKPSVDTHQIDASKARQARASFLVGEEEAMAVANDAAAQQAANAEIKKQAALLMEAKRVEKDRLAAAAQDARAAKETKRLELEDWKQSQTAVLTQKKKSQTTRDEWKSDFAKRAASFQ